MGFLDELRIDRETAHTRLLAWLLNPGGDHGMGDAVLRQFWSSAFHDGRAALRHADVRIEERQDLTRSDISIRTEDWYVLIENKVVESAFRLAQLQHHATGGQHRADRQGVGFRLVLLLPDRRRLPASLRSFRGEVHVVGWRDVASILRRVASSRSVPSTAPGRPFIVAYADFIEREILGIWKGFNVEVLTSDTVAAAARYITKRGELRTQLKRFCEEVHGGLGTAGKFKYSEEAEKDWDGTVCLFRFWYDIGRSWRTHVYVGFTCTAAAKTNRTLSLDIGLHAAERKTVSALKRRGLLVQSAIRRRLGESAVLYQESDEWADISENVPRDLWLTSEAEKSQKAVERATRLLSKYLRFGADLVKNIK
jgi:hypothetical protein